MKMTLLLSLMLMLMLFMLLFSAVAFVQDRRFFSTAPQQIKEVIKDKESRFMGQRVLGWFLLILSTISLKGIFIYAGIDGINNGYDLKALFVRFFAMMLLLKLFDILFFDVYLLSHSHFFQHYYPETIGNKGYESLGYNIKAHIRHIVLFFPMSYILARVFVNVAR